MKYIALLLSATAAINLKHHQEWPSVARCHNGADSSQVSSDWDACDHDNRLPHNHDGTTGTWNGAGTRPQTKERYQSLGQWPSVARCHNGADSSQVSSDWDACDHDNRLPHNHDGTTGTWNGAGTRPATKERYQSMGQWPSVARCSNGADSSQVSSDWDACDHDNRLPHVHDGTTGTWNGAGTRPQAKERYLSLAQYRPQAKCFDEKTGNPVTCDTNDVNDFSETARDENGFRPIRVVPGGVHSAAFSE